jgi:nuclear pore complex protein Nup98-Nup96
MEHSTIVLDERQLPRAVPNSELRFHHYASLFSQDDQSHEANTWRLGEALFDEIDLRLRTAVSSDIRELIAFVRRKRALSNWLQTTVAPSVESYLRTHPNARTSQRLFAMLTGNQVERATESALKEGDLHLATLLAQAGGDADFRADIEEQLVKWKDQVLDAHIDDSYRKIYSLLAGVVDILPASNSKDPVERSRELVIAEGLDWKRAFGLQLWFGTQLETPTAEALDNYQAVDRDLAALPLPWYRETPSSTSNRRLWRVNSRTPENDGLYELIRLDMDIAMPLEHALYPRAFSPSPLDFRLTWHLCVLLSSCLRRRDFTDRPQITLFHDSAEGQTRGVSTNASKVTASFASQLENQGLWELGVFVLLHLERSAEFVSFSWSLNPPCTDVTCSREVAVTAMISRNVLKLTNEAEERLRRNLNIPDAWIGEAKVRDRHQY